LTKIEKTKSQRKKRKPYTGGGSDESDDDDDDELKIIEPDPLYDPLMDDKDEEWVNKKYRNPSGRESDAVLTCPACFATLCYDCQRHSRYKGQYRAMFVQNCKVLNYEVRPLIGDTDPEMRYYPVHCEDCNTQIACIDSEEVYHFFHVLEGHG